MTAQEIRALLIDEKVRIMAAIWEYMSDHNEEVPISQELIDLLKEPQARVNSGKAQFFDWDNLKLATGCG